MPSFEEADRIFRERRERQDRLDQTGDVPMKSEGELLVDGNLLTALPGGSSSGGDSGTNMALHTFIFSENGIDQYWSLPATYLGVVP